MSVAVTIARGPMEELLLQAKGKERVLCTHRKLQAEAKSLKSPLPDQLSYPLCFILPSIPQPT